MSEFLNERVSPWLREPGVEGDVVLSSRIRLARNFAGYEFVNRASESARRTVFETAQRRIMGPDVAGAITHHGGEGEGMIWVDLGSVPPIQRRVLAERRLISRQLLEGPEPRAVAVSSPDECLAIMVNEEDHLRMQSIRPGFALTEAFDALDAVDDALEAHTDFAYHPRFGYLTACPTNVGTGLRVSVMLHLPALRLTGELEKVQRAAQAMSLAIRGSMGEGSEASGDVFQLSNQTTLGKSEREFLEDFETRVIPEVLGYERRAREHLMSKRRMYIEDHVFRAVGLLRSARLLKTEEAMELISGVRLGAAGGLLDLSVAVANELSLLVLPGHLQRHVGRALEQAERRVERARVCREIIESAL